MRSETVFANRRRGEVAARIDGGERRLCLTLGALAELEAAFDADNLSDLAERFGTGRLSARDLTIILAAGFRGGGDAVTLDEVAAMQFEGGVAGAAQLAVALLSSAFGEDGAEDGDRDGEAAADPAVPFAGKPRRFHGTKPSASVSAS